MRFNIHIYVHDVNTLVRSELKDEWNVCIQTWVYPDGRPDRKEYRTKPATHLDSWGIK